VIQFQRFLIETFGVSLVDSHAGVLVLRPIDVEGQASANVASPVTFRHSAKFLALLPYRRFHRPSVHRQATETFAVEVSMVVLVQVQPTGLPITWFQ